MSQLLNIPSSVQDVNYRYKMPKMVLRVEGKGKNIRTNITNLCEVAKALNVNTDYPLKFIGLEIGSRIIHEENGGDLITSIKGVFQSDELQKQLDKFISMYVICPNCKYPEMQLRIKGEKKAAAVEGKCNSCGNKAKLDNGHQMAQYMIKNVPIKHKNMAATVKKEEEKEDNKPKKLEKVQISEVNYLQASDLSIESKKLEEFVDLMKEIVKEKLENDKFSDPTSAKEIIVRELVSMEINRQLQDRLFYILFNGLFTTNFKQFTENNDHKSILKILGTELSRNELILDDIKTKFGGKIAQDILMNLQYTLFQQNDRQMTAKLIPTILKFFYDCESEIVTDDFLIQWKEDKQDLKNNFLYDEQRNKSFKEAAQPFLDWIVQSKDEEEEEKEEETDA